MSTPTPVTLHGETDWSGQAFGRPNPAFLTKAWRIKHGIRGTLTDGITPTLLGQDSITPADCSPGLKVYAGYFDGTFANLTAFRNTFPSAPYILSITPDGAKPARCIDCEPGDATVAQAARFVADNLPTAAGCGRNDLGRPMVYCSAGDSQAVINACAALGVSRDQFHLFSAHWLFREHICAPSVCGFPAADATQYASVVNFDSDMFYDYTFVPLAPPSPWPLQLGSTGALVTALQKNLNRWDTVLKFGRTLSPDGDYGLLTAAAVTVAERHFGNGGPAGMCDAPLYADLEKPVPVPPPPPPWKYTPVTALKVTAAGPHSVRFRFLGAAQAHEGLSQFEVVITKGALTAPIATYPRYIHSDGAGIYEQEYGGLTPDTRYVLGVRGVGADPTRDSPFATAVFTTAKAA